MANQGIMVDIAREALALSGYTLNYQTLNWARAKKMVQSGKLDGIVGMALTKNSKPLYHFPNMPLGQSQICLYQRAEENWVYESINSLEGKVFGWINSYGFSSDPLDGWVKQNKNTDRVMTISGKHTHSRLFQLLTLNRIDTFAEDKNVIAFELKKSNERSMVRRSRERRQSLS